jgi:hypothetical protein
LIETMRAGLNGWRAYTDGEHTELWEVIRLPLR